MTGAAACVLLLPGGIFVRALGRPATFGVALAASFAWSLAALAGALALTFALDATIRHDPSAASAVSLAPRLGAGAFPRPLASWE